ncbi:MAG: hypothetical protein ABIN37_04110 [Burkholderiaceae bacterium]
MNQSTMNNPPDDAVPLPQLSDEAAVEILDFLGALFQRFETHYANQIYRYYQANMKSHTGSHDEPF